MDEGKASPEGYLYATVAECKKYGCKRKHVSIQDLVPKAASADRKKLRDACRNGLILGTKQVPKKGETGHKGENTVRTNWFWHTDDPDFLKVKKIFGVN